MEFHEAYSIAIRRSSEFIRHATLVNESSNLYNMMDPASVNAYIVVPSTLLVFSVDDEYFYYGFNGKKIEMGKCNEHVSRFYRKTGFGLKVR